MKYIHIIPWDVDFIPALHEQIVNSENYLAEDTIIVFPHDRAKRYLHDVYKKQAIAEQKALFIPKILTVKEFFRLINNSNKYEANILDKISILYNVCKELANDETIDELNNLKLLFKKDENDFFAWGEKLAGVLEECLIQNVEPSDIHYADDMLSSYAAELLSVINKIFKLYLTKLEDKNYTSSGLEAYTAAKNIEHSDFIKNKNIFICGFANFSGTEDKVFRYLWENNAKVFLHTDPTIVDNNKKSHFSCHLNKLIIKKWNAKAILACKASKKEQNINFFAGYDLHSQLAELKTHIDDNNNPSTTIVLSNPSLLIPCLHTITDKNCNISLGYPVERTSLYYLFNVIMQLSEFASFDGDVELFPWNLLLDFITHPWIKNLKDSEGNSILELCTLFDKKLREGKSLQSAKDITNQIIAENVNQKNKEFLLKLFELSIYRWSKIDTLKALSEVLQEFVELIIEHGQDLWNGYPVESQCLVRIIQSTIPVLANNEMSSSKISLTLCNKLFKALLINERISFEADPLTGLQIIGLLETRLLHFNEVHILDATDDNLPGQPEVNALLPDSLRPLIGLPDSEDRNSLTANSIYRLIHGANNVYFYWQKGIGTGLFDSKKEPSRYIEELIWLEEQKQKKLLASNDAPLKSASPKLIPPKNKNFEIEHTSTIQKRIDELLNGHISSTMLDSYLRCPLNFYYKYIARLEGIKQVNDGDDLASVGTAIHDILKSIYEKHKNKIFSKSSFDFNELDDIISLHLKDSELLPNLTPDSAAMYKAALPIRLRKYFENQPENIKVLHLEENFYAKLGDFTLKGIIDRIDERSSNIYIVDYKTGQREPKVIPHSFWTKNSEIFEKINKWLENNDHELGREIYDNLNKKIPSLQLLFYMFLCKSNKGKMPYNAAYIDLSGDGKEIFLLNEEQETEEYTNELENCITKLLQFYVYHIKNSYTFFANSSSRCNFCVYKNLCLSNR